MSQLCSKNFGCISCCTRGLHRIRKEDLDFFLKQQSSIFNNSVSTPNEDNLKEYLRSLLKKNHSSSFLSLFNRRFRNVCEYLGIEDGKAGCMIHPKKIGREIRDTAPRLNITRKKCMQKDCAQSDMFYLLDKKDKQAILDKKDYFEFSKAVKFEVPIRYAGSKRKITEQEKGKILNLAKRRECYNFRDLKKKIDRIAG